MSAGMCLLLPRLKCLKDVLNLHSFPIAAAVNFLLAPFVYTHRWHLNSCELIYQLNGDLQQHTGTIENMWHVVVCDQALTFLLLSEPKLMIQALWAAFRVRASTDFLPFISKQTPHRPFSQASIFFFLPVSLFLYFSALFSPSDDSHPSLPPLSAGQINNVPGSSRKAQRVQLASISRQGGKDDRGRCWMRALSGHHLYLASAINPNTMVGVCKV